MMPSLHPLGLRDDVVADAPPPRTTTSELVVPTDLIVGAWRQVLPPERMMFIGGRRTTRRRCRASSVCDVTGANRSAVYVTSEPDLLMNCLLDFEATGASVVAWLHSHPGLGKSATFPSSIDRQQDDELRQHFGEQLVGLIATTDGFLRVWGRAIDEELVRLRFQGRGLEPVQGERHVFRIAVR